MSLHTIISYLIFLSIFSNEKHAIQHTYLLSRSKSCSRASKSKEKSRNLHIDIVVLSNFAAKSDLVLLRLSWLYIEQSTTVTYAYLQLLELQESKNRMKVCDERDKKGRKRGKGYTSPSPPLLPSFPLESCKISLRVEFLWHFFFF